MNECEPIVGFACLQYHTLGGAQTTQPRVYFTATHLLHPCIRNAQSFTIAAFLLYSLAMTYAIANV